MLHMICYSPVKMHEINGVTFILVTFVNWSLFDRIYTNFIRAAWKCLLGLLFPFKSFTVLKPQTAIFHVNLDLEINFF